MHGKDLLLYLLQLVTMIVFLVFEWLLAFEVALGLLLVFLEFLASLDVVIKH